MGDGWAGQRLGKRAKRLFVKLRNVPIAADAHLRKCHQLASIPSGLLGESGYAAEIIREPDTEDAISRQFHGGMYTPMGFDGDTARIE